MYEKAAPKGRLFFAQRSGQTRLLEEAGVTQTRAVRLDGIIPFHNRVTRHRSHVA
jgi:hypothetical protein